jgi:hypothetical protein
MAGMGFPPSPVAAGLHLHDFIVCRLIQTQAGEFTVLMLSILPSSVVTVAST